MRKAAFEDEIAISMCSNLTKQDDISLEQAVDYLALAAEICEDVGMYTQSNRILNLLKIATQNVQKMPSLADLNKLGITQYDIDHISNLMVKTKVYNKLLGAGYTETTIENLIGRENVPTSRQLSIWNYITDTLKESKKPKEDTIEFTSLAKKQKPKLTSKKMISNLLDHGHVFNKDSNDILDADVDKILEISEMDYLDSFEDER